jgi:hypothetical protein
MQILAQRAWNRYSAMFRWMAKLTMAPALTNLDPTICMEFSDHLTNLHDSQWWWDS